MGNCILVVWYVFTLLHSIIIFILHDATWCYYLLLAILILFMHCHDVYCALQFYDMMHSYDTTALIWRVATCSTVMQVRFSVLYSSVFWWCVFILWKTYQNWSLQYEFRYFLLPYLLHVEYDDRCTVHSRCHFLLYYDYRLFCYYSAYSHCWCMTVVYDDIWQAMKLMYCSPIYWLLSIMMSDASTYSFLPLPLILCIVVVWYLYIHSFDILFNTDVFSDMILMMFCSSVVLIDYSVLLMYYYDSIPIPLSDDTHLLKPLILAYEWYSILRVLRWVLLYHSYWWCETIRYDYDGDDVHWCLIHVILAYAWWYYYSIDILEAITVLLPFCVVWAWWYNDHCDTYLVIFIILFLFSSIIWPILFLIPVLWWLPMISLMIRWQWWWPTFYWYTDTFIDGGYWLVFEYLIFYSSMMPTFHYCMIPMTLRGKVKLMILMMILT